MKKLQILNSSLLVVLVLIGLYIVSNQLFDHKAVRTIIRLNDDYAKRVLLDPDVIQKQIVLFESDSVSTTYFLNQMQSSPKLSLEMLQALKQQGILDDGAYKKARMTLAIQGL